MKNKKILLGAMMISIFSITSYASADFDCSSIDRETMKTIMDKQKNSETLTSTEQETLDNMKTCMPSWTWAHMLWEHKIKNGSWTKMPEMSEEQKAKMEEVKTILEKQKNGETLTSDEQATLDAYETNKPKIWSGTNLSNKWTKNTGNLKINSSYKTKLDSAIDKIVDNMSSYSTEDKLTALTNLKTKVENAQSKIESSSYSDTKKSTYNNLFDYLLDKIESEIQELDTEDDDTEDLLEGLFE